MSYEGDVVYDKFINPAMPVTDYRTRWSGIRRSDLTNATPYAVARKEVRQSSPTGNGLIVKVFFSTFPLQKHTCNTYFSWCCCFLLCPSLFNFASRFLWDKLHVLSGYTGIGLHANISCQIRSVFQRTAKNIRFLIKCSYSGLVWKTCRVKVRLLFICVWLIVIFKNMSICHSPIIVVSL